MDLPFLRNSDPASSDSRKLASTAGTDTGICSLVLEFACTAWDIPLARDPGYSGPPMRAPLRTRSCPPPRLPRSVGGLGAKSPTSPDGKYRTKRVILGTYYAILGATRSRHLFETPIESPYADHRATHPAEQREKKAP